MEIVKKKRKVREFKNDDRADGLAPLQAWLEVTGFSRSNFKIMKPYLKEGEDYKILSGRYFINEESIKERIITLEPFWRELIANDRVAH